MTGYDWLVLLHIVAAIVWVGGGFATQVYAERARRSTDPARLAGFANDIAWAGTRVFAPASLLVIAVGIAMVLVEPAWDFGQLWIMLALVAVAISFITGATFLGPESGRIGALIEERGPEDPEVVRRIGRTLVISRIDYVVLLLVVVLMVFKPGA